MSFDPRKIENFTTEQLDKIAAAVHGETASERRDAYRQLINDCLAQMRPMISLADFDPSMEFAAYEMAYSFCHLGYTNGSRTSDKLSKERDNLQELYRQDGGSEIQDDKIQRQLNKIHALELRRIFWAAFYKAATQVLDEVVRNADPDLATYMTSHFEPKTNNTKTRRPTITKIEAERQLRKNDNKARNRQPKQQEYKPELDGIDAA